MTGILIIEQLFVGSNYADSSEQMLCLQRNGDFGAHSIASSGTQTLPPARIIHGPCMVSGLTSSSRHFSVTSVSFRLIAFP